MVFITVRSSDVARTLVRGGKHQTKFSVLSPEFRFEAVTFSKTLLTKDF